VAALTKLAPRTVGHSSDLALRSTPRGRMVPFAPIRMKSLAIYSLLLAAATAPAQQWIRADEGPGDVLFAVYDRVHQRLLACVRDTTETWSFDGSQWRRHLPSGLEPFPVETNNFLFAGFDEAQGEAVLATGGPGYVLRAFTTRDAGWWASAQTPPDVQSAAVATDPITNTLMTFGGRTSALYVDFTYRRTPTQWNLVPAAARPTARAGAAMATDRARGRVVLFGGADATGVLGDTWEWDGNVWTQITPAAAPSPRGAQMAYDPATQHVVLLGGFVSSTWQLDCWDWDGANWTPRGNLPEPTRALGYDDGTSLFVVTGTANVSVASGLGWVPLWLDPNPSGRAYPAFAYDPTRGETLLVRDVPASDTWTWNGTWQQRTANSPPFSSGAAMAPRGNTMILFGGRDPSIWPTYALNDDTWSWDGQAWTQLQPSQRPSPRVWHAMVDAGTYTLLFGGVDATGDLGDTWSWNGTNWTPLATATSPSPRFQTAMAFDTQRQRAVLFGGMDHQITLQDTWEWDGVTWIQSLPMHQPLSGTWPMAYEGAAGSVVLADYNGIWAWDGVDWTQTQAIGAFGQVVNALAAYDPVRQRTLALSFAGLSFFSPTPANVTISALPPCGSSPDLRLMGRPALGTTPTVHLEGAPSMPAAVLFGLQSTSVAWAPNCFQLVTADATVSGVLDANGQFDVAFPIPLALALRGLVIHSQAAVLDGGPVFRLSLSRAVQMLVGD
jgi:hypothetical protein